MKLRKYDASRKKMQSWIMMPGKGIITLYPQVYLRNKQIIFRYFSQMYYPQMTDARAVLLMLSLSGKGKLDS